MKEKLSERIDKLDFFNYLDKLKERADMCLKIYQASGKSLDVINFEDYICEPLRIIERAFFSKIEYDMIGWYLYEYDKDRMKIYHKETGEVLADITDNEELWNYLNDDEYKCWEEYQENDDEKMSLKNLTEMIFE